MEEQTKEHITVLQSKYEKGLYFLILKNGTFTFLKQTGPLKHSSPVKGFLKLTI